MLPCHRQSARRVSKCALRNRETRGYIIIVYTSLLLHQRAKEKERPPPVVLRFYDRSKTNGGTRAIVQKPDSPPPPRVIILLSRIYICIYNDCIQLGWARVLAARANRRLRLFWSMIVVLEYNMYKRRITNTPTVHARPSIVVALSHKTHRSVSSKLPLSFPLVTINILYIYIYVCIILITPQWPDFLVFSAVYLRARTRVARVMNRKPHNTIRTKPVRIWWVVYRFV